LAADRYLIFITDVEIHAFNMAEECVKRSDAVILSSTTCFRLSSEFWHCGRAVIITSDPPYEYLCKLNKLLKSYPTVAYILFCVGQSCAIIAIKRQRVAGWRATAYVNSKQEAIVVASFLEAFCGKASPSPARGSTFIEVRGECVRRI